METGRQESEHRMLLVDVSNTITKLALATPGEVLAVKRMPTSVVSRETVEKRIRRWAFARVVVSCVVPRRLRAFAGLRGLPWLEVGPRVNLGLGIVYPNPETIGADRLANAAGLVGCHGAPGVVVDFGTAVTFDVVSADANYIGGIIAPGLSAMTDYLHEHTALLPRLGPGDLEQIPPSAVGKSTREAMTIGTLLGYPAFVREILKTLAREVAGRKKLHVIATGGYAERMAALVPSISKVDPSITLEGLRIIANLNPGRMQPRS